MPGIPFSLHGHGCSVIISGVLSHVLLAFVASLSSSVVRGLNGNRTGHSHGVEPGGIEQRGTVAKVRYILIDDPPVETNHPFYSVTKTTLICFTFWTAILLYLIMFSYSAVAGYHKVVFYR